MTNKVIDHEKKLSNESYKQELRRIVIPLSEFIGDNESYQYSDVLNQHERTLYMGIMVKEFCLENSFVREIHEKLSEIDAIEFELEFVNDNEDTYDQERDFELSELLQIKNAEFEDLTEHLTQFDIEKIITTWRDY